VSISGNYACVADVYWGLRIINVSNPASPVEAGHFDTPGSASDVFVSGNYAYVADGDYGLRVVNVNNPAAAFEVGYCVPPSLGASIVVFVSGNYAYVKDFSHGLRIINISDPSAPYEVGHYDTPGQYANGIFASGNYVYVADQASGLRIIDVSNPAAPFEAGFYNASGLAKDVFVSGNYAYLADYWLGLLIIYISNPAAPVEVGRTATADSAWGVVVSGNYAYVADTWAGLQIIDVSDPTDPVEVGSCVYADNARSVRVSGNYAYVAYGLSGLRVINVSDPAAPYEVGYYDTPGYATDLYVSGNSVYVADANGGLFVLQYVEPPVGNYDFATDAQGWASQTVPGVFSEPDFAVSSGMVQIISHTNTNTFGFWQSAADAVPIAPNYVYRARFSVLSDQSDSSLVPQIRLRANSASLQQSDYLTIESSGNGDSSPTPSGVDYDLYFVPPSSDPHCSLAFDLLNFNPGDAAEATLSLDNVLVERFGTDSFSTPTLIRSYEFTADTDSWTSGGAPIVFTNPEFLYENGALTLRSMTNTNTFGSWSGNGTDITIAANALYRGTFEIRTDVTSQSMVPQMRLRFNTANLQASRILGIDSAGDGANSPSTANTIYDRLYFLPPANCVGEGLITSFDMLNFDPADAAAASLILDRATIESLTPPSSP
jgi:hypothetical protein